MTIKELRAILADLPDDLPVYVQDSGGDATEITVVGLAHVDRTTGEPYLLRDDPALTGLVLGGYDGGMRVVYRESVPVVPSRPPSAWLGAVEDRAGEWVAVVTDAE